MRRISTGLLRAAFAACFLLLGATPLAQLPTTIAISSHTQEVDDLLRRGQQLELERRWGDALTHYEEALRQFPAENSLQRRFDTARLHYDIQRRSIDRSFGDTLTRLPLDRTLDLYAQVLLKIDSHYVDTPDWKELVERGTNNLEIALSEPVFLERYVPEMYRTAARGFCVDLRPALAARPVHTREDAVQAVSAAAAMAQKRLGIPSTVTTLEYLCGATNSLDQYSSFLTPDQLNEVYSQIEGNFVGLGIELKVQAKSLTIIRVIAGSPAEQAGLRGRPHHRRRRPNDLLDVHRPGGQPPARRRRKLRGTDRGGRGWPGAPDERPPPKGRCPQRRPGGLDRPRKRRRIFQTQLLPKNHRPRPGRRLVETTARRHASLVIDLRGNPGGLLVASVEAVNRFVDRGVVVSTHGRSAEEDNTFTAHAEGTWQIPLVVIVDGDSASAAEIFAGAIHDLHRAQSSARGPTAKVRSKVSSPWKARPPASA